MENIPIMLRTSEMSLETTASATSSLLTSDAPHETLWLVWQQLVVYCVHSVPQVWRKKQSPWAKRQYQLSNPHCVHTHCVHFLLHSGTVTCLRTGCSCAMNEDKPYDGYRYYSIYLTDSEMDPPIGIIPFTLPIKRWTLPIRKSICGPTTTWTGLEISIHHDKKLCIFFFSLVGHQSH